MIQAVNSAMVELQSALSACMFYPPGQHVQACRQRAFDRLQKIMGDRSEIVLVAVDDRVIFEGEVLPSSESLLEGMFGLLGGVGVDRVTFRRGLDEREIGVLFDGLSACKADGPGQLQTTPHVEFGFITQSGDPVAVHPSGPQPKTVDMADSVRGVWEGVYDGRDQITNHLADLVTNIAGVVSKSANAMIPLAAVKRHDEYTFVHTINVAILSTALGEAVGFDSDTAYEVTMAALLHDIGKRIIPEELLNKSAKLTDDDMRVIRMHPAEGARLLFNMPVVPRLAPIVAYEHHLGSDGSGYPSVPADWRPSLASRVVQVADVFDALRTDRPYRAAMPMDKITEILQKNVRSEVDAELLKVFLQKIVARGLPEPAETSRTEVAA